MKYRKYDDIHREINGVLYKQCIDCGEWIEANLNNFGKNNNLKDGLSSRCKICRTKYHKDLYSKNSKTYKENIRQKILNNQLFNGVFNDYIIEGNITKIIMETNNGEKVITTIDTEDLERVISYGLRWRIRNAKNTGTRYARSSRWEIINEKPKLISYWLNILIMNPNAGEYVDHINHDTLDNRKENLRITSNSNNTRNRKSKNKNNKSGYRNVCWLKNENIWLVQLSIDGKNKRLGKFDDVHEAGKFAEEMRRKHYGEFAGLS